MLGEVFLFSSKARKGYAWGGIWYSSTAWECYAWGGIWYLSIARECYAWGGIFVLVGWQECCEGAAFWCFSYRRVDVGKRDGKKLEIETAKLAKSRAPGRTGVMWDKLTHQVEKLQHKRVSASWANWSN